eukprot:NODE_3121_length_1419_cov_44.077932_g2632_i1.p1 GENE.NODE_3121_length_1419_cov_44.077932_g2632_i1~~NODE_3121_length_1419_cov_44.077932_g2632_i1.p1  ORF type:complete len:280 (-),score=61.87 NODE_3121_length_1419_cov_44.077932_g2632_i1:323-1162(-)
MSKLNHPNILKLYQVLETPDEMCLELEIIEGGTLADLLQNRGSSLGELDAARIANGVLKGIQALHLSCPPIVHRDLKLENILVKDAETCHVVLSDFGLSKIFPDPASVKCTPVGTEYYIPPEIVKGLQSSQQPRSSNLEEVKALDLWSTGVVLYMLLSGTAPFQVSSIASSSQRKYLLDQINKGVPFPEAQWANISENAKELVKGLLHPDAKKRLDVNQALEHAWFQQVHNSVARVLNETVPTSPTLPNGIFQDRSSVLGSCVRSLLTSEPRTQLRGVA